MASIRRAQTFFGRKSFELKLDTDRGVFKVKNLDLAQVGAVVIHRIRFD
jgi:hypothetical protein